MKLASYVLPLSAAMILGLTGCPADDESGSGTNDGTTGTDSDPTDPTTPTMVTGSPTSDTMTMSGSGTSVGPTSDTMTSSTTDPDTGSTGTDSGSTGSSSGSSSSTGGSNVCDPDVNDSECVACTKMEANCCAELEACDVDDDCACFAECAGDATNLPELQACFGPCNLNAQALPQIVIDLLMCTATNCSDPCTTLPG